MAELKLPELGENITQGIVTRILVKNGDAIKKGQNILELETDKAVLEVPSSAEGVISEVLIKNGAVVKVGQPVFKLNDSSPAASTPTPTTAKTETKTTEMKQPSPSAVPAASISGGISDLKLPALGENIEKGTVTKILVKVGDQLQKGTNILEIETDKAVLEVPSPSVGVVKEILIKAGAVIKVGQPIFKVEGGAAATPNVTPVPTRGHVAEAPTSGGDRNVSPSRLPTDEGLQLKAPQGNNPTPPTAPMPIRKDIPAAPSARLLARELGIDIGQVPGSGRGGRISIENVKAYCKLLNTSPAAGGTGRPNSAQPLPNFTKWGTVRREAMNSVRKKTAEHLSHAWNNIPHVTQFDKVDITELEKLRKSISGTKKISVTPFIIKVVAAALKKFPQFNSSIDMSTQEIIYKDYVNIGVAVDTDRGLLVPVLKNVD